MSGKRPIGESIREAADASFRDTEIEYQLMAYLLRVNPSMSSSLERDWFSDVVLQDVFDIVRDLRITMSAAMIMNELRDRAMMDVKEEGVFDECLEQVMALDTAGYNEKNARHMVVQILRLYESRRVLTGCADVITSLRSFDLDVAQESLKELSRKATLVDENNTGYYLDDYEDRVATLEERLQQAEDSENEHVGIPTGIYRFDRLTGGMLPGEFGFLMGITGVGKTAALLEFGCNAWEAGFDVMIVSGEMSKEELQFRIDSRLTRINGLKFRNAELDDEEQVKWRSTISMYRAKHENTLFVAAYGPGFTSDDYERDLLRVQEETGRKIKMLCLDYINIVSAKPDNKKKSKDGWQDQQGAVWDFKGICSEYNLVGWTAGQVIDDAYEKELYAPSDAKYARAISEAAYVMIGLIRTAKDIIEKRMKFQVVKVRNAPEVPKPISLTPNLGIMRLHEEIRTHKTLAGMTPDTIDIQAKTKKPRPRKSLHGR